MVQCVKLGRELPGLEQPPFAGELGERIFEHVSQQAWAMWPEQAKLIINHYGLNLGDPDARAMLRQQMEEYFFGENAQMPEGWSAPSAKGGDAPRSKGGAAPARK
jgi:Fe-S cluster biosynthesis and repair protein YggX